MFRTALAGLLVAAVALVIATAAMSRSAKTTVNGTVGPGFTIKLTKGGKKVTSLKPGSYTFKISDKSDFHNFTLEQQKGGKFEKHLTATAFKGNKSVTVKLKAGKWKYYCSVHESSMHGFFTVK
jgi:plastocyanin